MFPRIPPYLRAFGVRARDGGAIGILSITDRHTDKNGLGHVEGSKTSRAAALELFFPNDALIRKTKDHQTIDRR